MTTRIKYWLFRVANFTFRLVIPAVAAAIIWGFISFQDNPAAETSVTMKVQAGAIVIIVLAFGELKNYLGKIFRQFGLEKQVAFMKNNGFIFLIIATILLLVQMFADKAITFFYVAGASKVMAYICEIYVNKLYRELNPSQSDRMSAKLDRMIGQLEAASTAEE